MQTSSPGYAGRPGSAAVVEDLHLHPEGEALDLAPPHGQGGVPLGETADDVRAARDGREPHVRLHRVVHEVERLGDERRAGGQDCAHAREVVGLARAKARLLDRVEVLCGRAEDVDPGRVGEVEEGAHVRPPGRALVEGEAGSAAKPRHEPVPHHPPAGGEVEEGIAGAHVRVEAVLLEVLEQGPAGAVDDALRSTGGPRRIHDVERVVERDRLELDLAGGVGQGQLVPGDRPGNRPEVRRLAKIRHDDRPLHARDAGEDLPDAPERIDRGPVVAVAVRGDENPRLDLPETIEHPLHPEVGRARGPHRPEAGRGEHRDDRLGEVRQVARDPVPGTDAGRSEALCGPRDVAVELAPGDDPVVDAVGVRGGHFAPEHDGWPVVAAPEEVLGEVEARVRKPARARHPIRVRENGAALRFGEDLAEVPDAVPERGGLRHRPGMEGRVVRHLDPVALAHVGGETGDPRPLDLLRARLPQRPAHRSRFPDCAIARSRNVK